MMDSFLTSFSTSFITLSPEIIGLLLAALTAGFVDAVAGGGGLIQVPALLAAFPSESPATLFGTNKIASVIGTGNAAWRYGRRIGILWEIALPTTIAAMIFSFAGAAAVSWLPRELARPLVMGLLVAVLLYTLRQRNLGATTSQQIPRQRSRALMLLVGAVLGFYDGFFGPGMGSFLIFAFVRWFDLDFLNASATAKIVNMGTNLAALVWFAPNGHVLLSLGLAMAVCNLIGAQLGALQAIKRGSGFVRVIFLVATTMLLIKLGLDIYLGK